MNWNIASDRPVYIQLIEQIELAIVTGQFSQIEKLPSVRELAADAGVNPNTMQKALQELENLGLITTHRTSGRTITQDEKMLDALRQQKAQQQAAIFLDNMQKLGFSQKEILNILQKLIKEE